MLRDAIIRLLKNHLKELKQRFQVASISIFGSVARGEDRPESDLDVLVRFNCPTTFDLYMDLKFYLEDLCDRKVDLVTERAVPEKLKPHINADIIHVS